MLFQVNALSDLFFEGADASSRVTFWLLGSQGISLTVLVCADGIRAVLLVCAWGRGSAWAGPHCTRVRERVQSRAYGCLVGGQQA